MRCLASVSTLSAGCCSYSNPAQKNVKCIILFYYFYDHEMIVTMSPYRHRWWWCWSCIHRKVAVLQALHSVSLLTSYFLSRHEFWSSSFKWSSRRCCRIVVDIVLGSGCGGTNRRCATIGWFPPRTAFCRGDGQGPQGGFRHEDAWVQGGDTEFPVGRRRRIGYVMLGASL